MSEELRYRGLNNLAGIVHPIASRKKSRLARLRGFSDHHLGNGALKETQIRFLLSYVRAGTQFRSRIFEIVSDQSDLLLGALLFGLLQGPGQLAR